MIEMFEHNLWANLALIEVCVDLDDAVLDATVEGTYGTVRDTLYHLVGAESRYALRLTGAQMTPAVETVRPPLSELPKMASDSGKSLIDMAGKARTEPLHLEFQGKPYVVQPSVILVQAVNHATEHRSQIATILTQNGVTPPELDSWGHGFVTGRLAEATDRAR